MSNYVSCVGTPKQVEESVDASDKMGVPLEIGKMFAYIMVPISFFHYYSHQDPAYFRKMRDEHALDIFSHGSKKTEEFVQQRLKSEFQSTSYNSGDAFWQYGEGRKMKEDAETANARRV